MFERTARKILGFQPPFVLGPGRRPFALEQPQQSTIVMNFGAVRRLLESPVETARGLVELPSLLVKTSQVGPGGWKIGLQPQRFPVVLNGLVQLVLMRQRQRQPVPNLWESRLKLEGMAIMDNR